MTEESSEVVNDSRYRPLRARDSRSPQHLNADDRALFTHDYAGSKMSLENYTKKSNTDFDLSESSVKGRVAAKNAQILKQNQPSPMNRGYGVQGILKSNDNSSQKVN